VAAAPIVWADNDVGVEVEIDGPPRSIGVRAYTQLLNEVRLALEEVDKFALPGRTPRIDWAVQDLSVNGGIRAVFAPRRVPPRRPVVTVAASAAGFVGGVNLLQQSTPLGNDQTVRIHFDMMVEFVE
jgi:hypothetical protein